MKEKTLFDQQPRCKSEGHAIEKSTRRLPGTAAHFLDGRNAANAVALPAFRRMQGTAPSASSNYAMDAQDLVTRALRILAETSPPSVPGAVDPQRQARLGILERQQRQER
jgi:hypothetical protein